jgi:NADH dehydrogenase
VGQEDIKFKDGGSLPYDLLVWAGGVKPASAIAHFGLVLDKRGAIVVDTFLEATPRVYAIGDVASFINPKTGRPLPGNIPVAEAGALVAAFNITAEISHSERHRFKTAKEYPFILAVGGKYAVSDVVGIKLFGFIGWIVKQFIELRYLLVLLPIKKAVAMWLRTVYYSSSND